VTERAKVFIIGHVTPDLERAFLQYVRDFDTNHPGCHFQIAVHGPSMTIEEMMEAVRIDPPLTFTKVFERHTLVPDAVKAVIAALPDDKAEGLRVLEQARRLVERFKGDES
jgi:hypothetical protein